MNEERDGCPLQSQEPDPILQESDERYRRAFEAATTGFGIAGLDERVLHVNDSMCAMVGYTRAELLRRSFRDITHPDDRATDAELLRRVVAGEIPGYQREKRYVHRNGHILWTMVAVSPVRDAWGAPQYLVGQATNITARKAAEEALRRHAADLERSNAELEQFAYVASHALQQPLRAISSYTRLFAARYHGELDERAERWIGFIVGGVERMQRLTNDLLALARVRTEGESLAPTGMRAVVDRAWKQLRAERSVANALLRVGMLPVVDADETQLEQLFQNLLDNACKYRRPDVPLVISVSATRREPTGPNAPARGSCWEFVVRDNGIGFQMAHAERIFEIFRRLHREHEYAGTGIGLAICRRIVERHGGRIWAESVPGRGSAFFFTLPERRPAQADAER